MSEEIERWDAHGYRRQFESERARVVELEDCLKVIRSMAQTTGDPALTLEMVGKYAGWAMTSFWQFDNEASP